jgi:hypothetical protein
MAAISGGALLAASVAAGAVSSAAQGSAARRSQRAAQAASEADAEKDRQHEIAMREREIKRSRDAIASWKNYDFGAKPLIKRPAATAPAPEASQDAAMAREAFARGGSADFVPGSTGHEGAAGGGMDMRGLLSRFNRF